MPREDACEELAVQQHRDQEKLGAFTAELMRLSHLSYPDFIADVQDVQEELE